MKKKKVIACILAMIATLAIASMSTGCAIKDKVKEWFNEDPLTSSNPLLEDSEEESSISDYPYFDGSGNAYEDDNVYIMPEECTCYVGDTFRIQAESDGFEPKFSYIGYASEYVALDSHGNVTAINAGIAYLSVSFEDKSYLVKITILDSPTDLENSETTESFTE